MGAGIAVILTLQYIDVYGHQKIKTIRTAAEDQQMDGRSKMFVPGLEIPVDKNTR